jgi:two-component system, sensor histidine kinase YesM
MKIRIMNKLLISHLILSIIIIVILGVISYRIAERSIEEEVRKSSMKTLEQIAFQISLLVDNIINMSNLMYVDQNVARALRTEDPFEQSRFDTVLRELFYNYSYVNSLLEYNIAIYGRNGKSYTVLPYGDDGAAKRWRSLEELKAEPWYPAVVAKDGVILWLTSHQVGGGARPETVFYAVRLIKDEITGQPVGVLVIDFAEKRVRDAYIGLPTDSSVIFLTDETGRVISRQQNVRDGLIEGWNLPSALLGEQTGSRLESLDGHRMLVIFHTIGKTNWKLVQIIPRSHLLAGLNTIKFFIILTSLLCVVLGLILSLYIARLISGPIDRLIACMRQVQSGNFAAPELDTAREDEIGQLNRGFSKMTGDLKQLMDDLIREQEQKRRAELNFLQAQINPHFLYNTLSTIRLMVNMGKAKSADSMLITLVKLLKKTLSKDEELITIGEELETLRNYVTIQQYRYDNFEVAYDVDESLLNYRMIKLTLQPLVENAIFHGLHSRGGKGTVRITAKRWEKGIRIQVTDDGDGIAAHVLPTLFAEKEDRNLLGGLGLKSVRDRLALHFRPPYGLLVNSTPGAGTTVEIRIPAIRN